MNLKKSLFMISKLYHDVVNKGEPYRISRDLLSSKLGEYYFLFEEDPAKLNRLISGFDENGVPVNSSYIDVETPKTHYYPISIGQYGLALFNTFVSNSSSEKLAHFLRIADWFLLNKTEDDKLGTYWLTDVPKPEYKIYKPWKSAFTQSRAISVLLRAWQQTNDKKYLDSAVFALTPYTFDITEGGVSAFTKYGKFYEEYVAEQPTMVLDGHIFSMLGLLDFSRAFKDAPDNTNCILAKNLFDEGVESLIQWLKDYDLGYWLRFNMCEMQHYPKVDPCTIGYLRLVTLQLKLLYKLTYRKEFEEYINKFIKYDKLPNMIRMYPVKYEALKKLKRI